MSTFEIVRKSTHSGPSTFQSPQFESLQILTRLNYRECCGMSNSRRRNSARSSSSISIPSSSSHNKSTSSLPWRRRSHKKAWLRLQPCLVTFLRRSEVDAEREEAKIKSIIRSIMGPSTRTLSPRTRVEQVHLEVDILNSSLALVDERSALLHPKFRSEQQVLLLKSVLWCLIEWKTLSMAPYRDYRECSVLVRNFENHFIQILKQVRLESAISSKLEASTKSLALLSSLASIQAGWNALLSEGFTSKLQHPDLIARHEVFVVTEVLDKERRETTASAAPPSPAFLATFNELLEQLRKDCKKGRHPTTMGKIGGLIKGLVAVFEESSLAQGHRDHPFFHRLTKGVNGESVRFKRALAWVVLGLIPKLTEAGGTIRLFHLVQGIFRQAVAGTKGEDERKEVALWKQTLDMTLSREDLDFFHEAVLPRISFLEYGYTRRSFEDFYPLERKRREPAEVGGQHQVQTNEVQAKIKEVVQESQYQGEMDEIEVHDLNFEDEEEEELAKVGGHDQLDELQVIIEQKKQEKAEAKPLAGGWKTFKECYPASSSDEEDEDDDQSNDEERRGQGEGQGQQEEEGEGEVVSDMDIDTSLHFHEPEKDWWTYY